MDNTNTLQADLEELERLVIAHDNAADACAAARAEHERAVAAAGTWGPMFAEAKQAWTGVVNAREATLAGHEQWQRDTAAGVRKTHATLAAMHEANTAALGEFPQVHGSGPGSLDGRSGGGDSSMGTGPISNVATIDGRQWEPVTEPPSLARP
jgi:hypothetical protein